jgi:hypothetical protein
MLRFFFFRPARLNLPFFLPRTPFSIIIATENSAKNHQKETLNHLAMLFIFILTMKLAVSLHR